MSRQISTNEVRVPFLFFLVTMVSIFVAELVVMSLVLKFTGPYHSHSKVALFDAFFLTTLLIPQLYLFLYKPLRDSIAKLKKAEIELQKNNELLENKVTERTNQLEKLNLLLQKEYQQELYLSEERHKKIIDNTAVGISVIDPNLNLLFINKTMKKWFPSLKFTINSPCYEAFKQYNHNKICLDCPVAKAFSTGKTHQTEHKVKLGVLIKYYRIIASPVFNEQGQVTSVIETSVDITEKKLAELKIMKLNQELESLVHQKEAKSALAQEESNRKLADALKETVNALVTVGEKRDPYTAGHQHRVAVLSKAIGKELGLSDKQLEAVFIAGTLHDIGKIYIPSDILNKPGRLTNLEFDLIKTHPEISHDIINRIPFELPIAEIVIQHHERLDGSGYPKGLKGNEICLEARILAVADVVEAMASHRPYRPAIGLEKALEELKVHVGTCYDQRVVDACTRLIKEKGFQFI